MVNLSGCIFFWCWRVLHLLWLRWGFQQWPHRHSTTMLEWALAAWNFGEHQAALGSSLDPTGPQLNCSWRPKCCSTRIILAWPFFRAVTAQMRVTPSHLNLRQHMRTLVNIHPSSQGQASTLQVALSRKPTVSWLHRRLITEITDQHWLAPVHSGITCHSAMQGMARHGMVCMQAGRKACLV